MTLKVKQKNDLKSNRAQRYGHATVQSGWSILGQHIFEDVEGGAAVGWLMHDGAERVQRVTGYHAGCAAEPSGHKLSAKTACEKLC